MRRIYMLALAASGLLFATSAQAQIIDLSATDTANGAKSIVLGAGSYSVSLINNTANGGFEAWSPSENNFGTPSANHDNLWTDYYDYTINGVTTRVPGGGRAGETRYATPDVAFAAYSAFAPLQLSFDTATTVTFAIGDNLSSFGDNAGGMSLSIAAAAPEPSTWLMMIGGFGIAGYALRRRKTRSTVAFA